MLCYPDLTCASAKALGSQNKVRQTQMATMLQHSDLDNEHLFAFQANAAKMRTHTEGILEAAPEEHQKQTA